MQFQIDCCWVIQLIKYHPDIVIEDIARKMRCSIGTASGLVGILIKQGTVLQKTILLDNVQRLTYFLA